MIRVYTTGDPAKVINLPVLRYWPFVVFITKSMGVTLIKFAITFRVFSTCPNPTSVSFLYFDYKSLYWRRQYSGAWLVMSRSPVGHIALFAHLAFDYVNRLVTLVTVHGNCCSLNFSRYSVHLPQQCVAHSLMLVSGSTP